jgi:hypothetical protein
MEMSAERLAVPQVSATVRERIQAQGFCDLDDATYAQIDYPLRISPAICMVWAALGTALASPTILWALAPFAALGAILPAHPFDVPYNYVLRHLLATPKLPRYGARRHFACAVALTFVIAAAWSFQAGLPILGQVFGWYMVAGTLVNVSLGFCVPAFFLRLIFGKVVSA